MHSFSSNPIFHACGDNLKLRRHPPAETIQIGVTEVPGQVRQTYFPSDTKNLSTFRNMRFDTSRFPGKWSDSSGDRISSLTSGFKLARFIFSRLLLEKQNANNETLHTTVWKLRLVWKKMNFIEITPSPPPSGNSWAFEPSTPRKFPIPYGYFLELHILWLTI